ncbi:MAG: hypothetical protein ACJAXL_000522 [Alphaproteobacteria bacterium]|jgi:hypothetical protein
MHVTSKQLPPQGRKLPQEKNAPLRKSSSDTQESIKLHPTLESKGFARFQNCATFYLERLEKHRTCISTEGTNSMECVDTLQEGICSTNIPNLDPRKLTKEALYECLLSNYGDISVPVLKDVKSKLIENFNDQSNNLYQESPAFYERLLWAFDFKIAKENKKTTPNIEVLYDDTIKIHCDSILNPEQARNTD